MAFTKKTFDYLKDLEGNNDKTWFEANRERYEMHWKSPALDFIAAVSGRMAKLDPALQASPKLNGSLRRINRDARFSKDKSPYNPRLHIVFWSGEHPNRSPGMHFVLSKEGVGYGAGLWGIEPKALQSYRARILDADEGDRLVSALERAAEVGCRMGKPELARMPKGFNAEGPRAELLRYKSFVARTHEKPSPQSRIIGKKAEDWVMQTTEALMPLIRWLNA